MADFKHYTDIPVRAADLDAFGHVNNAKYLTYIEHARFSYMDALGLWQGDVKDAGVIIADIHVAFIAPAFFRSSVRVGTRIARLGGKSMRYEHELRESVTGELLATAEAIIVAYDYTAHKTVPVPDAWRRKIATFEGIAEREQNQ
jgi:acyl-CoA thioester hydrolase